MASPRKPKKSAQVKRIRTKAGFRYINQATGRFVSVNVWRDAVALRKAEKPPRNQRKRERIPSSVPGEFWSRDDAGRFTQPEPWRDYRGRFFAVVGREKQAHDKGDARRKLAPAERRSLGRFLPPGEPESRTLLKAVIIEAGFIPKPDAQRIVKDLDGQLWGQQYFGFEGLDAHPTAKQLIRNIRDIAKQQGVWTQIRYAVGVGTGDGAEWVGSRFNLPNDALIRFDDWNKTPSAMEMFRQAKRGARIWFEIEVRTLGKYLPTVSM